MPGGHVHGIRLAAGRRLLHAIERNDRTAAAQGVGDSVGGHPVQPVLERLLVAVAGERPVDLEEYLLGDVFRQAELAEGSEGDVDHQPVVTGHELTEGLLVPRRAPLDQPAVFSIPLYRGSVFGPGHLPTVCRPPREGLATPVSRRVAGAGRSGSAAPGARGPPANPRWRRAGRWPR